MRSPTGTVRDVVELPAVRDPALPFVTFYDESSGERTELSTTSLQNWQAKTANYLRDGLGLEPGGRVGLDLPLHWVVSVWLAACRSLSVTVEMTREPGSRPDVAVIGPESVANPPLADDLVACSLRPLAQPFAMALPTGIEDYFAEVRGYGDHFSGLPFDPSDLLLNLGDGDLDASGLAAEVGDQIAKLQLSAGARILVTPFEHAAPSPVTATQLLAMYDLPRAVRGSVVIVVNADPERIAVIADQERVTVHLGE